MATPPRTGLRVAVDLHVLDRAGMEHTGLGRYALEILRALRAARPDWRLTAHTNRPELLPEDDGLALRGTRWPTESTLGRVAWLRFGRTDPDGADVWFEPAFVIPRRWRGPAVVAIHDLAFALRPSLYRGRLNSLHARREVARSARRADAILCPSTATAARVRSHLGIPSARIHTAPLGVSEPFRDGPAERRDDGGRFLLFVGRWEIRKGLDVLAGALRELEQRGVELPLVLAGGPGWRAGETVRELRRAHRVEVVEEPDDEELAALYASALAFVYPSRMEGFGLPVAEAMACGCAVVCSDLPEIRSWAGDAPLYFPPGDAVALADRLAELALDAGALSRARTLGLGVGSSLNWQRPAEAAAQAIEAAAEESAA